ncbi:hypothetical protein BO94DRAFT_475327 [Aspergillus sclerotioniger CBS 115572]|uniref:Uncharacterized protein n=1 Tax=Aspergillus sclerotioniger CBS 115572 TaxID=1450535 RepID=A0A317VGW9_9EURO|nr:hypothetical protein BO94DRAFT_475327 [Aspergillus sclerotioniger CBS 115572]PWY73195.1 hypothetical protein BO94DRAFT_475327 [Aspergillus sclerotioniger CBS 115572]
MLPTRGIALSGQKGSRPQALACQLCHRSVSPAPVPQSLVTRSYASSSPLTRNARLGQLRPQKSPRSPWTAIKYNPTPSRLQSTKSDQLTSVDFDEAVAQIAHECAELRKTDSVPPTDKVVKLLERCQKIAEAIVQPEQDTGKTSSSKQQPDEIASLLDLEERKTTRKPQQSATLPPKTPEQIIDRLCKAVHDLLTDEKVFISPEALTCYTKIHTMLKRLDHFPEIFHLYANKPVPEENSSPVKYHKAKPQSINSSVPVELADMALDVAIDQRNLSLVLAIIDTTFCAPAFRRAKLFKKAAVPLGGLAAAPAACYTIASWAATLQNTMDPSTATGIAFAATLAYVGGISSVGILAITTANDQMERVVWQPGVPLRHRWLREEERAAFDKVALAWGFKDIYMRGEEEGEEWDTLREFIGMRGMILDKTDLMAGMQ